MKTHSTLLVPVVYEHAAAFLGKSPWEVGHSADLMARAHIKAWKEYRHSPITVGIDVYNLEAECYGARVEKPEGTEVPSIKEFPFQSVEEILRLPLFDPLQTGRFPLVFQAARTVRETIPDVDVRIPLGGPFSIASNLVGFETLLVGAFSEPDQVREALLHLAEGQLRIAQVARSEGFGITFFESAATPPLLSPELFQQVELPALKRVIEGTGELYGQRPPFIMGGNTFPVLPYVLECRPSFLICPGETDQKAFMEYLKPIQDILVRVNMVVEIVANGSEEDLFQETRRVFLLTRGRNPRLIGTGVLPYNVNPDRVHLMEEFVERCVREEQDSGMV
jgi:uroporphyrinogen-III decarboxylase